MQPLLRPASLDTISWWVHVLALGPEAALLIQLEALMLNLQIDASSGNAMLHHNICQYRQHNELQHLTYNMDFDFNNRNLSLPPYVF